jgi:hypothetical protein
MTKTPFVFWKAKPPPLVADLRMWSLLVPSCCTAFGLFVFAVFGFSFTAIPSLPQQMLNTLVVIGGLALAFGGEIGTLTNSVEVFRKQAAGEAGWLDWVGIFVSACATFAEHMIAQAALASFQRGWVSFWQTDGIIVLLVLCVLDAYFGYLETGRYLNSYAKRMESWQGAYEREYKKHLAGESTVSAAIAGDDLLKPFRCEVCGKQWETQAKLSGHMKAHAGNGHRKKVVAREVAS